VVRVGGREFALRRTYSDVRPGEYLALVNSFGVVEIAQARAQGRGRAPVVGEVMRGSNTCPEASQCCRGLRPIRSVFRTRAAPDSPKVPAVEIGTRKQRLDRADLLDVTQG
jgi:hypothetical protein